MYSVDGGTIDKNNLDELTLESDSSDEDEFFDAISTISGNK